MKYIDSEKLIAEIERLKDGIGIGLCEYDAGEENGKMEILIELSSFIATLQQEQPEVDLEKEIIRYQREDMVRDTTVGDVARHFYKLGLNARKEE